MNLLDTAKQAGSFNKLTAAVEAAGLSDTLKGDGPFTVFAPTDASDVTFSKEDGAVHVDRANVIKADVEASNGIIHDIDEVILSK